MADLVFEFAQDELNDLIQNSPQGHSVKFSIFSASEGNNARNLFIAAQPFDSSTGAALTSARIPVGCPVPPGWGAIRPTITASQLVNNTSFIISGEKTSNIKMNGRPHLIAKLEGFSNGNGHLEAKLSFKIKDAQGRMIKEENAPVL
jgi:hypothetical protein